MKKPTLNIKSGFSLVELLVVIAVIAVIAAIAIPNISSITGSAQTSRAMRNAQTIASVYNAARAAGWSVPAHTTSALAAAAVTATGGVTGGTDEGAGIPGTMSFGAPMESAEITDAVPYLRVSGNVLEYVTSS